MLWFLDRDSKNIYLNKPYLVLDFEATASSGGALNKDNDLVLACWTIVTDSGVKSKYVFADEYGMGELLEDIRSVEFVVAQNAKYELQWLKRCGLELRDVKVWCTMLAQWVLDGNQRKPRSLAALAETYNVPRKMDLVGKLWKAGMGTKDIPASWLLSYCKRDVLATWKIFERQLEEVYNRDQQHLVLVRNLTCACLADIEFNGMHLDEERVEREYDRVSAELGRSENELVGISDGINFASGKQRGIFLYETLGFDVPKDRKGNPLKTAGGAYPTDSATIHALVAHTEEQKRFLDSYSRYNRARTLLTKNLDFFRGVCREYGGVFRAIFNQNVTQTHRLSSSGMPVLFKGKKKAQGVQMQNIPREYKKLFWSGDEDYLIGEADGAQLEFRVAADLCHDPVAIEEISVGADIHSFTAKALTDAGEPTSRQEAKSRTFRPLYGGMSGTKAEVAYIEFFKNKYKGISDTQRSWALHVLNNGFVRTRYGMQFFWPGTKMSRSGYIENSTSIYNYPVQGFATGEIIPIALVFFWHRSRGLDIEIINTIHDSVVSKAHKDCVDEYKRLSVQCFTHDVFAFLKEVYDYDFVTPLGAGIKVSRNWGDTPKEITYNVFKDGTFTVKEKG